MVRWLILGMFCLSSSAFAQDKEKGKDDGFAFPSDLGGKKLTQLLQPGRPTDQRTTRTTPLDRAGLPALESPQAPLPGFQVTPPRIFLPPTTLKAPPHPAEERPLARYTSEPHTPQLVGFPVNALLRWESLDLNLPLPLPILATPNKDRASLADPSLESSIAAALAEVTLSRTSPVPFAPVNLPDPFENRQAVRVTNTPPEETQPAIRSPRLPNQ